MWKKLIIVILILLAAVALLSVSIWAKKGGRFPNIHVGRNPAMRKRGIGCVEEQDRQAQHKSHLAVNEKSNNN